MNGVKITYVICTMVCEIFYVCAAISIPIWLTPGYYWWTGFCVLMMIGSSCGFSKRANSWGDFGNVA